MAPDPEAKVHEGISPFQLALMAAMGLGLVETAKGYWAGQSAPVDFGWANAIAGNLSWWLLWGLLTPLIFKLVDRWPLQDRNLRRALPRHLAVAVIMAAFHLTASAVLPWAVNARAYWTYGEVVRDFVFAYFVSDIVTYGAIVAAYSGYRSRKALRAAEREQHALELRTAHVEADAARLTAQMTEARLAALRMELNPHFLFNTLNTVSALARRGDGEEAIDVLARLSELLRETLQEDRDNEIPLEEELAILDGYLAIERIRFGERLTIDVVVDPSVRSALVPTFLLQPLVENAMRHGVGATRGPVSLQIEATRTETRLAVVVRDTGPGLTTRSEANGQGVGLRNTRDRLEVMYGAAAELELATHEDGGAEVRVSLPLNLARKVRVPT